MDELATGLSTYEGFIGALDGMIVVVKNGGIVNSAHIQSIIDNMDYDMPHAFASLETMATETDHSDLRQAIVDKVVLLTGSKYSSYAVSAIKHLSDDIENPFSINNVNVLREK